MLEKSIILPDSGVDGLYATAFEDNKGPIEGSGYQTISYVKDANKLYQLKGKGPILQAISYV